MKKFVAIAMIVTALAAGAPATVAHVAVMNDHDPVTFSPALLAVMNDHDPVTFSIKA